MQRFTAAKDNSESFEEKITKVKLKLAHKVWILKRKYIEKDKAHFVGGILENCPVVSGLLLLLFKKQNFS